MAVMGARGTELWRLLAAKTGKRGARQPMELFVTDEAAAQSAAQSL